MTTFTVIAYRWGLRDNHSYFIGVFSNKDKAIEVAEYHKSLRGDKYSCEVIESIIDNYDEDKDEDNYEIIYPLTLCGIYKN